MQLDSTAFIYCVMNLHIYFTPPKNCSYCDLVVELGQIAISIIFGLILQPNSEPWILSG